MIMKQLFSDQQPQEIPHWQQLTPEQLANERKRVIEQVMNERRRITQEIITRLEKRDTTS